MDIVMLAAGTSSRMGATNKMLLDYKGLPMVTHSCLEALQFLQSYSLKTDNSCNLIVVTGYRRRSVEKVLAPCRELIQQTKARLAMVVVNNPDYRKGQFTSTKVGVAQVQSTEGFFISLADMPLITPEHYSTLLPELEGFDVVRPFSQQEPGHPVLFSKAVQGSILNKPDDYAMNKVIREFKVREMVFQSPSWALDIDLPENYQALVN